MNNNIKNKIVFSIIVPVYNREKTIKNCIEGILNTEFSYYEIILINDGSTDNTLNICQELSNQHPNVRIITTTNKGVSAARNIGIQKSKGKYIIFVDSDDTLYPNALQSLYNYLYNDLDLLMFDHAASTIKEKELAFSPLNSKIICKDIKGNYDIINYIFTDYKPYKKPFYTVWGKVFRADIIKNNNIFFNETCSLGEDQIFVCQFLKHVNNYRYLNMAYYQAVKWSFQQRSFGLGGMFRTPEDYLYNHKLNYMALDSLYKHCKLQSVKKYSVNYILDRPISRIIFNHSKLINKKRVSFHNLLVFTQKNIKPVLLLEYHNIDMLHDKHIASYAKMIVNNLNLCVIARSYIEQNLIIVKRKLKSIFKIKLNIFLTFKL